MKKRMNYKLSVSVVSFCLFVLWTLLVRVVDLRQIGPNGSAVGFGGFNGMVRDLIGVNMLLYDLTDILSIIPICVAGGFGFLGLCQLIRRRSLFKVDKSILLLGVFYILVIAVYLIFEVAVINYRPILIDGVLEASYPSSTTLLVTCIMPTALMQLRRIKNRAVNITLCLSIIAFTLFMVAARVISGVHWASDIIGGVLISAALVSLYAWAIERFGDKSCKWLDREKPYNK